MKKAALVWTLTAFAGGLATGWCWQEGKARARAGLPPSEYPSVVDGAPADPRAKSAAPKTGDRQKPDPEESAALPAWNPALSAAENELALYAALENVPAERIAAWLNGKYRLPVNHSSSRVNLEWETTQSALVDRLLEKDPTAFAQWVSVIPQGNLHWNWVEAAARALRTAGGPGADEAAARLKAAHPQVWRPLELQLLAESNPQAALAKVGETSRETLPEACADLLASDPARALAYVGKNPSAVTAVAQAFKRLGPEALEQFAENCPGGPEATGHLWQMVAVDKARAGDGQAFAAFLKEHRGIREMPAALLADANPEAVADAVQALAGEPILQNLLLAALAPGDPAQAARLLAASPDALAVTEVNTSNLGLGESLMNGLVKSWMLLDAAAFKDWTRSLPAALQAKVTAQALPGMTGTEFLDFTRGTALPDERVIASMASQAARETPDTASLRAWLGSFSPGDQEKLVSGLCAPLAARDLTAATELTVNLPDLQQRERMTVRIAQSANFTDPRQALEWGAALPGDLRISGTSEALRSMAGNARGWNSALTGAVSELIAAQPAESLPAWNTLATTVTQEKAFENFPEGVAFWSTLPEPLREASQGAMGYSLVRKMTALSDPFPLLRDLEQLPDAALRRSVAGLVQEYLPDFKQLTKDQAAALAGQLEKLSR